MRRTSLPLGPVVIVYHQTGTGGPLTALALSPHLPPPIYALIRTSYMGAIFILSGFVLACSHSLVAPWSRPEMYRCWRAHFSPLYVLALVLMIPFRWIAIQSDCSLLNLAKEGVIAAAA